MIELTTNQLKGIKYFNALSDKHLQIILKAPENGVEEYSYKDIIIKENDIGEYMYVLLEGLTEVYVRGEQNNRDICIATLKPGDYFGEQSVINEEPTRRTATIMATMPTKVFKIHKKYVLRAINKSDDLKAAIPVADEYDTVCKLPIFHGLTDDEILNMKKWTTISDYKKGDFIFKPGEDADGLYIVLKGKAEIYVMDAYNNKHINYYAEKGQIFGEIELLPGGNGKHYQYVLSLADTRVIEIYKYIFDNLLERNPKLTTYIKQMSQVKKLNLKHTTFSKK